MKTIICLLLVFLLDLRPLHGEEESLPTKAADKPGVCPPVVSLALGVCKKSCTTDSECLGNLKCCRTGCDGYQCQTPNEKPGICPENSNSTTCDSTIHCSADSKCMGDQKCCPTGCDGSACQIPKTI
ncbi:WAP four-disulfide core domain protein 2-like [Pelobates fuscus]|uniref:WAP four-disulfide core domain protein 2-like n=1 Tax=Pelobates fuscus TaxID=191477 RepID=UPI002FE46F03